MVAGESVQGVDEKGLDYLLSQAGVTLDDVRGLIKSMNDVLGNKKVQESLVQTAVNLKELTGNMNADNGSNGHIIGKIINKILIK